MDKTKWKRTSIPAFKVIPRIEFGIPLDVFNCQELLVIFDVDQNGSWQSKILNNTLVATSGEYFAAFPPNDQFVFSYINGGTTLALTYGSSTRNMYIDSVWYR